MGWRLQCELLWIAKVLQSSLSPPLIQLRRILLLNQQHLMRNIRRFLSYRSELGLPATPPPRTPWACNASSNKVFEVALSILISAISPIYFNNDLPSWSNSLSSTNFTISFWKEISSSKNLAFVSLTSVFDHSDGSWLFTFWISFLKESSPPYIKHSQEWDVIYMFKIKEIPSRHPLTLWGFEWCGYLQHVIEST